MFYWALVKSTKPKVFVMNKSVNFAWMVMENLDHTCNVILEKNYNRMKRLKREGPPYTCHLMRIFKHFKINFKGYAKKMVKESWFVKKTSLKNMKIYKTAIHEHVFWEYLRDNDIMPRKHDPKLKKQHMFLRLGAGFKEEP